MEKSENLANLSPMTDRKKSIIGWLLILAPIPTLILTLGLYAIYAFQMVSTLSEQDVMAGAKAIQILFGVIGILSVLGIVLGMPFGVYLLTSRTSSSLPESVSPKSARLYQSASAFAKVTVGCLLGFSIAASIDVVFQTAILGYLNTLSLDAQAPALKLLSLFDHLNIIIFTFFAASACALLRWKFLAYRNALIQNPNLRYSHHMAAFSYLIPFVNLVTPYRAMKELAKYHGADVATRLLWIWWFCFLFAQIAIQFAPSGSDIGTVLQEIWHVVGQLVWDISLIFSAIALIFIVFDITKRQEHSFKAKR